MDLQRDAEDLALGRPPQDLGCGASGKDAVALTPLREAPARRVKNLDLDARDDAAHRQGEKAAVHVHILGAHGELGRMDDFRVELGLVAHRLAANADLEDSLEVPRGAVPGQRDVDPGRTTGLDALIAVVEFLPVLPFEPHEERIEALVDLERDVRPRPFGSEDLVFECELHGVGPSGAERGERDKKEK